MDISKSSQIKRAKRIEDILCLAVLVTHQAIPYWSTIDDAHQYFRNLPNNKNAFFDAGDCSLCPFKEHCLACVINE